MIAALKKQTKKKTPCLVTLNTSNSNSFLSRGLGSRTGQSQTVPPSFSFIYYFFIAYLLSGHYVPEVVLGTWKTGKVNSTAFRS